MYDVDEVGDCEVGYCSNNAGFNAYRLFFSYQCLTDISDLYYCKNIFMSEHCFGCCSMKRAKYCILNKEYTQLAYEQQCAKLVDHMKETGEW